MKNYDVKKKKKNSSRSLLSDKHVFRIFPCEQFILILMYYASIPILLFLLLFISYWRRMLMSSIDRLVGRSMQRRRSFLSFSRTSCLEKTSQNERTRGGGEGRRRRGRREHRVIFCVVLFSRVPCLRERLTIYTHAMFNVIRQTRECHHYSTTSSCSV